MCLHPQRHHGLRKASSHTVWFGTSDHSDRDFTWVLVVMPAQVRYRVPVRRTYEITQVDAIETRHSFGMIAIAAAMLAAVGCTNDPVQRGGLVLVIKQDGSLDLNRLHVDVQSAGQTILDESYRVPQDAELPTTIGIVSNGNDRASVDIAVAAWRTETGQETVALDLRELTVTKVPTSRTAMLEVILSARCTDTVEWADDKVRSKCPTKRTCDPSVGDCSSSSTVNAETFEDFQPGKELEPAPHESDSQSAGETSLSETTVASDAGAGQISATNSPATSTSEERRSEGSDTSSHTATSVVAETDLRTTNPSESTVTDTASSSSTGGADSTGPYTATGTTSSSDSSVQPERSEAVCANGRSEEPETCDDGNRQDDDGCDAECRLEIGWSCDSGSGSCVPVCGDSLLRGEEALAGRCDDGNGVRNDGCSETCLVETGYVCGGEPYSCFASCGDGEMQSPEICDDGNALPGDGCFACALEPDATCDSVITSKRACGEDSNVYALDMCGQPATRLEQCPGDCVDDACRCVIRVSREGNDNNSGNTWSRAKRTIEAALDAAEVGRCEIWVLEGLYEPWRNGGYPDSDRTASFRLRPGVGLYGGFRGTESRRSQRDWQAHQSVLFGGKYPTEVDPEKGVLNIVVGAPDSIVDGFVITGGNGIDPDNFEQCGGALLSNTGRQRVSNVVFRDNVGVAVCATPGASIEFDGCTFESNEGLNRSYSVFGRALFARDSSVSILNSTFSSHFGSDDGEEFGGAVAALGGNLSIRGSRFENNRTSAQGGAIYCGDGCQLLVRSSSFIGNSAGGRGNSRSEFGGGAITGESSNVVIVDSVFTENVAARAGGALAVSNSTLEVHDCNFARNSAADKVASGGALFAIGSEMVVSGCLFQENTAGPDDVTSGGAIAMNGGGGRLINNTFLLNAAFDPNPGSTPELNGIGGAVMLRLNAVALLQNSLFWQNDAEMGDDLFVEEGSLLTIDASTFSSAASCFPSELDCPMVDPRFLDVASGDFTPTNPSCIDTGNTAALPADTGDLDQDGDTEEALPLDILGNQRVQGSSVDLGAIEAR